MASIVDRPTTLKKDDLLEMEKYTNGLIRFIESSNTPMTIGVQGEWGSGKTSLLNTIREELCNDSAEYHPIWINTWEYSLLSTPEATLVKIISGLIIQISALTDSDTRQTLKASIDKVGSAISLVGKMFGGTPGQIAEVAGDAIKSTVNKPQDNSIKALRNALQEVINQTIDSPNNPNKKAFIFFIDDLDRLDPTVAVNILELIKNLFDLEKCIFVLAIDYGVVVKGLQSKFGVMTEENEWEFRAFFDKIIQLPFSMPISSYNIEKYLQSLLVEVSYFDKIDLENKEILSKIADTVGLSVGTNPRALKRLANSVSLIEIIRGNDNISADERVIEFALICIQIAYPFIYTLIQKESDFTSWDDKFAYEVIRKKDTDMKDLEALKGEEEFNEPWEQALWKICQISSFLKQRTFQLSQLLNFIKVNTPEKKDETMSDTLDRLLRMSSVTSVSTESIVPENKRKKHTRLSPKKKQEIANDIQSVINERVKNKHVNYFINQPDFKIALQGDKRNVWLPVKIDDVEFDLCVWTDHRNIKIYANSKVSNEKTVAWFTENIDNIYQKIEFNESAKEGKKVVVLGEYPIENHKQVMREYKKAIEDTFNKFLSKVNI